MESNHSPAVPADQGPITVTRWTDEAGRRTSRWYWEARFGGRVVGAGILGTPPKGHRRYTEADVWQHAARALAQAAYVAGLRDSDSGAFLPPLGPPLEDSPAGTETAR